MEPGTKRVVGFVVASKSKKFLSRSGKWVKKRKRLRTQGIERAWVHTEEVVKTGGAWSGEARCVYPAVYDPGISENTQITGEAIPITTFALCEQS